MSQRVKDKFKRAWERQPKEEQAKLLEEYKAMAADPKHAWRSLLCKGWSQAEFQCMCGLLEEALKKK